MRHRLVDLVLLWGVALGSLIAAGPSHAGLTVTPGSSTKPPKPASSGISGTVLDEGGLPIPGVSVAVGRAPPDPAGPGDGLQTDSSGRFKFEGLPVGEVTVRLSKPGFESQTLAVQVNAGRTAHVNATLRVVEAPVVAAPRRGRAVTEAVARVSAPLEVEPAADAGILPPAVRDALARSGWTPTSDHSSTWTAGDILATASSSPIVFGAQCFEAAPREGFYTSIDVVQALKAGGKLPLLGVARVEAQGMQYKQVRYAEPYVSELSRMDLRPTADCLAFLESEASRGADLQQWFVIQAVMKAEVKEELCREVSVGVGVGRVGVEGSVTDQCVRGSEGQVAVAFKLLPVAHIR